MKANTIRFTIEDTLEELLHQINDLGKSENTEVFPMEDYDRMHDCCIQIAQLIAAMKVRHVLWRKRDD